MLSQERQSETATGELERRLRIPIPSRFLHGPSVTTVRQADGSWLRISFCRRCRSWHTMLIWFEDDDLVLESAAPFSSMLVRGGEA